MSQIANIVNGHINELLNLNQDISEIRLNICKVCPIYSSKFGGLCNNKLWLNPDTNDVSLQQKNGYIRGCGCRLKAKTTLQGEHCPADKW